MGKESHTGEFALPYGNDSELAPQRDEEWIVAVEDHLQDREFEIVERLHRATLHKVAAEGQPCGCAQSTCSGTGRTASWRACTWRRIALPDGARNRNRDRVRERLSRRGSSRSPLSRGAGRGSVAADE